MSKDKVRKAKAEMVISDLQEKAENADLVK